MPHPTYHDFAIEIEPTPGGGFQARVSHQSGDSAPTPFVLPPALERLGPALARLETAVHLRDVRTQTRQVVPIRLEDIGAELFDALLQGGVGEAFREACRLAHSEGRNLRLRLVLDPKATEGPIPLAALPWEILYDRSCGRFLSQSPRTAVVRQLRRERFDDPRLQPVNGVLRILVVAAQPRDTGMIDVRAERERIEDGLGLSPRVRLSFLETPTLPALREALERIQPHVLHVIGHGDFDPPSGEGALLLVDGRGHTDVVTGRQLAMKIQGCTQLRLAVLNACNSGAMPRRHGLDPFSGVAAALVHDGLSAVVAMQFPISDPAAIAFGGAFYRALAERRPLEEALTTGRQAIHDQLRNGEWSTPALYLRVDHGQLFQTEKETDVEHKIRPRETLIQKTTERFVGRHFVFDAIDRFLIDHPCGYFVIEGDPGIGKTAILAQLVTLHHYPHHFNVRGENDSNRAPHFLLNVCAQLIVRHGLPYTALPPEAVEGPAFFLRLLEEVSAKLAEGERLVIAVDALDEVADAEAFPGSNVLFLPVHLPERVYFVLTTRRPPQDKPEHWQLYVDCPLERFVLRHDDPANQADVRKYVERESDRHALEDWWRKQKLSHGDFIALFERLSEGNFRYLHHVLPELRQGGLYQDQVVERLPHGLEEYYRDHWARMRELCGQDWYDYQLPVLAALTVVQRPLPFELILYLTQTEKPVQVLTVLLAWEAFFHVEPDPSNNVRLQRYRFYHATFIEFVGRQPEVSLTSTTRRMKELLYADFVKGG